MKTGTIIFMAALLIGSPILLVSLAVGLLIGLLQAATQVQEQTVSFVPKLIAMLVVLNCQTCLALTRRTNHNE